MVRIGELVMAVESDNLDEVKRVGNIMKNEVWTVNWIGHAQRAKNEKIKEYLLEKAASNKTSKILLRRGGGSQKTATKRAKRRQSRRRYTLRR